MELAEPHAVRVLDDKGIDVGDIDARLNDGGTHQHLDVALGHAPHDAAQLALGHLAVGRLHHHAVSQQLPQAGGGGVDALHAVVQVVYLPAALSSSRRMASLRMPQSCSST